MSWFLLEIDEVFKTLSSSPEGIAGVEAERRLAEYGPNKLEEGKKKTPLMMFLGQFTDFMIIVLISAAAVSGIIGDVTDTLVILLIVVLNAIIGFVQEYRAEKAIEALKSMTAPTAAVKRDGAVMTVRAEEIVPGDAVLLDAGRIVPADLRLFESANLKIEEAALTGESTPVEKRTTRLHDKHLPIGDRRNMAYKGTIVVYGRGAGIAVETGMTTEFGKIAAMLAGEEETKTPLQKRMAKFGQQISLAVLAICAIIFVVGFLRGEDPLFMFLTAISLAVAAIPEALPVVVAISLALGAKKLVHGNVLIRRLPAVEALGSVTYICSDKTGTLTLNKMTVEEVFVDGKLLAGERIAAGGNSAAERLFIAMALCNDVERDAKGKPIGDPTEAALFLAAEKAGFVKSALEKTKPRVAEIPFDSDRKMMTTFHKDPDGGYVSFTKGGVEVVMERAIETQNLGAAAKKTLLRENERMASDGLRVLAIGTRKWSDLPIDMSPDAVEKELTVLGFAGILDPPREEAKEAIKLCKLAGIKPIMITGDHPITAKAIARRLGMVDDGGEVMTGPMLDKLTLEEFEEKVERIRVYARVAPAQKLKIVKALQDKGEFVAMTGDGVNDAPALKRADIGVSMGITGTDVAKEASHMILLDDNFASIVGAIRKGRQIYDNIRKFIKYTMTSNTAEIWAILLPPFLGMPIALLPIHILWINLVTDGLPGLALTVEGEEKGVMNRPPRPPQESVFAHGMGTHIIWVGLAMGAVSIFSQALSIRMGLHWQTMVFTVLCLSQMGHVLAIRSERESFFTLGAFSNMPLVGAVLLTFALQLALIYVPFLQPIFKTEALSFGELMFALALSSVIFAVVEAEKFFKR
ncbi:MAG: cation-translocating P-type ATPase, partial [Deltaproteobacteria bacterium]